MLRSSLKKYTDVQEKACHPKETIENVLEKLKKIDIPILKEIFRIDNLDRIGVPVYVCKVYEEVGNLLGMSESFGKGITSEQAEASALMELIERYSNFTFLLKENFFVESYNNLSKETIPIEFFLAPLPDIFKENGFFEELKNIKLRWNKAYDLVRSEIVSFPLYWFYRIYGTTGWAAGNTLEEATLQALCEIIERHCISVVMEEKLEVPTIEIDSIEIPLLKDLIDKVLSSGIEIVIKDFSLGFEIPTIAVITHDPLAPTSTLKIYGAAGTHPNPKFALIRALTELIQHRAQILYREKVLKKVGGPTYCFLNFKSLEDADFLLKGEKISFDKLPSFSHPDFKVEIEYVVQELYKKGLKPYLIETTNQLLEIPSVIVVIPGARLNRPSTKLHPYLLISRQLMDIKFYKEALFYIEKTFREAPDYKNLPQILSQAAICAKLAGDYKKSMEYYENLLGIYPQLMQSSKFVNEFMEVLELVSTTS